MEPKISVALPVYNGANFLREALDSVLAQTFGDFELVISDNCSSDETPEILEEYANRDTRIRVSRSDEFLPQADNVNRSVELCQTEWVKLFCHDDLMKPNCLQVINHVLSDHRIESVGLIGNGEEWLFENGYCRPLGLADPGKQPVAVWQGQEFLKTGLVGNGAIGLPALTTATVRKRAWQSGGQFDRRFSHFDIFLWTLLLLSWDYAFIPDVLTTNRIHGGQVAVAIRKSLKSAEDHRVFWKEFLEAHRNELKIDNRTALLISLKPASVVASAVAIQIVKRNYCQALNIFSRARLEWWPVLPPLILRNLRRERIKAASLEQYVPLNQVYPG